MTAAGSVTAHDVVVVGAGLAGISAALEAADRGAQVALVERRKHIGGLTWSFQRNGLWFDNGQHVFLRCCTAYRQFLDRIGAADQVVLQDRLEIPVLAPGGQRATISRNGLPAPLHLGSSLARYRHLSVADRARLLRPVAALLRLRPDDPELDHVTFGAWLAARGQHPRAIERLWDLIVLPTVNVPAADASLALAVKVFRTGLLDSNDGADVGWSAVPLRQLHGDNGRRALADSGVELVLDDPVDAITTGDHGVAVTTAGRELRAGSVIVTTPPAVTEQLLPGVLEPLEGLGSSPIVNVHLVFDRQVTELPIAAAVGSPAQFVFDRTESSGLREMPELRGGQYLAVSLSAADAYIGQRPEDLIESFVTALGDLYPRVRTAQLVDGVVSREHAATFRGVPGTAAHRPGNRTKVEGLLVAGAWCDTGWPATMEGAVRSGVAAARMAVPGSTHDAPRAALQEAPR
jgi:squalene-associated FAD-dependent desaturase